MTAIPHDINDHAGFFFIYKKRLLSEEPLSSITKGETYLKL